jgi:ribosomal protein L11 methylase PrmA
LTILLISTAVGHDPDDPAVVAALARVSNNEVKPALWMKLRLWITG